MTTQLRKFINGFSYAFEGLKSGFSQRNFKFHSMMAVVVIAASVYYQVSPLEWALVFLTIAAVMAAELFNSAVESICDLLAQKLKLDYYDTWDPRNLAAAAVLLTSVAALIVGLIIFLPKVIFSLGL